MARWSTIVKIHPVIKWDRNINYKCSKLLCITVYKSVFMKLQKKLRSIKINKTKLPNVRIEYP